VMFGREDGGKAAAQDPQKLYLTLVPCASSRPPTCTPHPALLPILSSFTQPCSPNNDGKLSLPAYLTARADPPHPPTHVLHHHIHRLLTPRSFHPPRQSPTLHRHTTTGLARSRNYNSTVGEMVCQRWSVDGVLASSARQYGEGGTTAQGHLSVSVGLSSAGCSWGAVLGV
jgi:hypothetical protein